MIGTGKYFVFKIKRLGRMLKKIKVKQRFIYFGYYSSIHGMRHIFNNKPFISRLFWLLVVIVSAGSLCLLLARVDSISFTPETQYISWTTKFPAITVCEAYSPQAAQKRLAGRYPDLVGSLSFDFKKHFAAILYGQGSCGKSYCVPCGEKVSCTLPWREIADNVRLKCHELVSNCTFNKRNFTCCEKFHVVDSEFGTCYSINTLHGDEQHKDPLVTVNSTTGPGAMSFRVLANAVVSVHSPGELSTNVLDVELQFPVKIYEENRIRFLFSVVEIENDPKLTYEDVSVRQCRYLDEIPSEALYNYPLYSYGACRLVQYTEDFFEHCHCIHPIRHMSYVDHFCNYSGLHCLLNYKVAKELRNADDVTEDNCLPTCEESELTKIHISRWTVEEEPRQGTLVTVQMASLPTLRFHRRLMYTNLDRVVAVGGLVGLFFSASILSLVEIIYLIFRPRV